MHQLFQSDAVDSATAHLESQPDVTNNMHADLGRNETNTTELLLESRMLLEMEKNVELNYKTLTFSQLFITASLPI